MSKLKLLGVNHSDNLDTPEYAFNILKGYIPKDKVIFEGFLGGGKLKRKMEQEGYKVISSEDFFKDILTFKFDIFISNPPFSLKDKILKTLYETKKPFALLLPITALEGIKRQELYKKYGIKILFPKKRIDFNGKKAVWFYTAWFCYKINLKKELNFI